VTGETFQYWMDCFKSGSCLSTRQGEAADGPYTNPVYAPPTWWEGLAHRVCSRVLITAGEHECMLDDQTAMAESLRNIPDMDVKFVVEPQGTHDSLMIDSDAGRPKTDLMRSTTAWLEQSFKMYS
jgi:acetyl esterase/lipase